MAKVRDILFQQYASTSRSKVLKEFQEQYEPKKGERFNCNGITYEISPIEVDGDALQFEISSKIPKEELTGKMNRDDYFEAVKKSAVIKSKTPVYIGMDDIIHRVGDKEIKKRDYTRIKYRYEYSELFDEKAILAEVESIAKGQKTVEIPEIPGVQSIFGRLAVLHLGETIYQNLKKSMQTLLDANEKVRKHIK